VRIGLVGTVAFLLVGLLPEEQLLSWGSRVLFLLIAVSLYVRLRVEESPVFRPPAGGPRRSPSPTPRHPRHPARHRADRGDPLRIMLQPVFGAPSSRCRTSSRWSRPSLRHLPPGGRGAGRLIAGALLTPAGAPWWIAVYIIGLCAISLLAFLAAPESKDVDITRAQAPW
jgi:hypothetical protein